MSDTDLRKNKPTALDKRNLKVLCVGLACVDTLLTCKSYPIEDSDQRCLDRTMQVGGNAANNCTVLSHLGVPCEFFGTLSHCYHSKFVAEHFKTRGICFKSCVYHNSDDYVFPSSTIIINNENGSRTILHYRKDWPEVTVEDFKKLDFSQYSWVHFEGRNINETIEMIQWIDLWNNENSTKNSTKRIQVSVELEKPRTELQNLLPLTDVVFISKDYAHFRGCSRMSQALKDLAAYIKPHASLIVPWGELGASAQGPDGKMVQSPAYIPTKVVDTLGAGDTFCAAVISSLNLNKSIEDSIIFGCKIAGAKVGMFGYKGLEKFSATESF